jgi:hypothetical protein
LNTIPISMVEFAKYPRNSDLEESMILCPAFRVFPALELTWGTRSKHWDNRDPSDIMA